MSKNHFLLQGKSWTLLAFATATLALASCDDVYDGKETWKSDVFNQTLTSPNASDITIKASTDGTKTTISWPVVHGAKGYEVSVKDITDKANPVTVDSIDNKFVDGCSLTFSRTEDTNYEVSIRTLGNESNNNKDAAEATTKTFTSFTPTYATIPAGSDIAEWVANNPIPADSVGKMLCIDLEGGAQYTLSDKVNFGNQQVTLRTTDKTNHAKIAYTGENASIKTSALLTLKYLDIDASASLKPVIELSETPNEAINGALSGSQYYNIYGGAFTINNCNITGINQNLIYDGNVKYCIEQLLINNSTIHLTSNSSTNISGNAIIYFKAGFANTLTVKNSTFWNTGNSDAKYFVQYNNSARADRAGYAEQYVIFQNSTFYNVVKKGQWANYSAFNGNKGTNITVTSNIFVDCGNKQVARRIMGGRTASSYKDGKISFGFNTYLYNGEYESTNGSVESYDTSGTAIEEDPDFKDPANGNFTISGATQIAKKTGDPRWLPETAN